MLTEPSCPRRAGPATGRIGSGGGPSPSALVVEFAQRTSVGAQREVNEDAIGCWPGDGGMLFAVADGVGGYDDGALASTTALAGLTRALVASPPGWGPLKRLRRAVAQANLAVYDGGLGRMRTTLTVTLLGPSTLTTAHVGDCRLLLVRDGVLRQLTTDHNLGAQRADYRDPGSRLLTRCLGQDPYVRIDTVSLALRPGDVYLQCSDGLAALPASGMRDILLARDPATAAELLIRRALEAGADDDTSVQVVSVLSCRPPATSPSWLEALRIGSLLGRGAP